MVTFLGLWVWSIGGLCFFYLADFGFTGSVGVMPRPLAVFDDKKTADKMIILHLMNDSTLVLNNQ